MEDPAILMLRSRAAADRAIALDPKLSLPHISAAVCATLRWDLKRAREEIDIARRLDPGSPLVHWANGHLLTVLGDYSAARTELTLARQNDPVTPLIGFTSAQTEYFAERFETAVELLNEVLELEQDFPLAHYYRGLSLAYLGRFDEARVELRKSRLNAHVLATDEAWVSARAGDPKPAEALIAIRTRLVALGEEPAVGLTLPAIAAGRYDLAIESLEAMAKANAPELAHIKADPRLAPLRSHPRFQAVARQVFPN